MDERLAVVCQATGYPEPVVIWSSLDSKEVNVVDGSLVFDRVDPSIEGRYKCEASNGAGDPVSKVIAIRVNGTGGEF